jgi:hypothetical protein
MQMGHAPEQAGGVDADHDEPYHPVDDGLRTWSLLDAKGPSQ